jgi:hypothetical protein
MLLQLDSNRLVAIIRDEPHVLFATAPPTWVRRLNNEESIMHIEISTDKNIDGSEGGATHFKEVVQNALSHFDSQITRLEVHLSDVNAGKSGQDDKHCMIEARLEGRQPEAVTHAAATLDQAVKGAADKLKRSLESTLGRLHDDH